MAGTGPFSRFCALIVAVTLALPATAWAGEEDVGWPYRGPSELRTGGSGDDGEDAGAIDTGDSGDTGDTTDPGQTDSGDGSGLGLGKGKQATLVGDILWSWWWEYNKDRFLARVTERGRVNPGSAAYWFGSGAKFPPRDITPVTAAQRRQIYDTLAVRIKEDKSMAVRKAACIAMGRLRAVPANDVEAKAAETNDKLSNNMCARTLVEVVKNEKDPELRNHAILGLGLTGDPKGCAAMLAVLPSLPAETNQPTALIALGLARLPEAIPAIVSRLPKRANSESEVEIAAVHALGLYGPEFREEIEKAKLKELKGNPIEHLEHLAGSKSGKDRVPEQAITALARLQAGLKEVKSATGNKSLAVKHAAILALAEYQKEEEADDAFKTLKKAYKGSQQTKNFVLLSSGDLASRLGENSKAREQILKWLNDKKQIGSNDNYTRACAALALGVAGDQTAVPMIAAYLEDTTIDDYVAGACSIALGLLRAADKADLVINRVVKGKYNADAKGYGLMGLAMMGDTTRMDVVLNAAQKEQQKETQRQAPLAIGVLGDRNQIRTLNGYFDKKWKQKDRTPVSQAVFGQSWIRDASSVDSLLKLASTSAEPQVRAMAVIAVGYIGSPDRVSGLTRCFVGANYKKEFNGFPTLFHISEIL